MWVALQRRRQSANRLPQDQCKALNDLGFVWSIRERRTSSSEPRVVFTSSAAEKVQENTWGLFSA